MTIFPDASSRLDAVARLAAVFAEPVTWNSLAAVARELAALAPRLEPAEVSPPVGLRERLLAQSPPPSNPPQAAAPQRAGLRLMALMLDVAAQGAPAAMRRCLDELAAEPDAPAVMQRMTPFLDATGLVRDLSANDIAEIATRLPRDGTRIAFAVGALGLLGLSKTASPPVRRQAFEAAATPYMHSVARAGSAEAILAAEVAVYENYIKSIETPEHHTETFAVIEDAYASLAAEPAPPAPAARTDHPPRVAFLIPHGQMLAHTEVLVSFLTGLRQLEAAPIEPIVLLYAAVEGRDLGQKLDALGVKWEALGPTPGGIEARYRRLRERCTALQVDAAVVVSLPLHLAYFCRRPVAPVQVWWSMKFALPNFAVDGRVFYRSLLDRKIEIAGRTWRGGPLAFTPPPRPAPDAVAAIRARYPGMKILGTIAREEKIANAEYLEAVVAVLRRHPDVCFLWTGRNPLAEVQAAFERGGVAERCHFIGWVDPAPHIAAFDLFLETYPLTGLMCGWAMAFGKPVVSVGPLGFLGTYLQPLFDGTVAADPDAIAGVRRLFEPVAGRLPGIWADRPGDIPAFVDALLADPALAASLGACQQRYVETFMADEAASAATQARHFAEIVREARAAR